MGFTKYKPDKFVEMVKLRFGTTVLSPEDLKTLSKDKISVPWRATSRRVGRNYDILAVLETETITPSKSVSKPKKSVKAPVIKDTPKLVTTAAGVKSVMGSNETAIPSKTPGFVKWGTYNDIKSIIESRRFFPVFITGLSGNGKTLNVKQACAETERGFHRVNVTIETSEDDLVGGFRLINGDSIYEYGPVLKAMMNGDVLLLDEIDLGGPKMMALQSVLEGNGYYIKKLSKWVYPKDGFTVIATANTKGRGSEDGRFQFTNVMNDAMLERFKITIEQPYPSVTDERKILTSMLKVFQGTKRLQESEKRVVDMLAEWSGVVRESFETGAVEDVISTRRNIIIAETYTIYNDIEKSINLCISRFDEETRAAFLSTYRTVDKKVAKKYAREEKAEYLKNDNTLSESPFAARDFVRVEPVVPIAANVPDTPNVNGVDGDLARMRAAALNTIA